MTRSTLFLLSCLLGLLASDGVVALRPKSASIGPPRFGRKSTNEVDVIASTPPPALCPHTGCKCSPMMSAKIVLSAALETCLLYTIVNLAVKVNTVELPCNPKPDGISFCLDGYDARRHIQAILIVSIIFAAAFFGNIIDSGLSAGLSAATRQILDPNLNPNEGWYTNLKKPSWNPPGWLFPIMWIIVSKPTQFMAVWKLVRQHYTEDLTIPLVVYCGHLSLGDMWNKVFFGLECTGRGLAVICTFWSVLALSAYLFYNVDKYSGLLLLPTLGWVTVATALNWSIYLLNKDENGNGDDYELEEGLIAD